MTNTLLFSTLTDVTLGFEDANSKLLDVVSIADALECVDDRLVKILKLIFGRDLDPEYLSRC